MAARRGDPWAAAVAHLIAADRRFGPIVERHGPCALRPRKERFGSLVRAIIGQQVSTKAARSIDRKLRDLVGDPHEPEALLAAPVETLRAAGLSAAKAGYVRNVAAAVIDGSLPLHRLGRLADDRIIERMTAIKGVGRWTAEMYLIFVLNRPDVLPVHDLGIRVGLKRLYGLAEPPRPNDCFGLAEAWRPYRSVASWYLWRTLDNAPPPGRRD
jgi:DNA-3-methyladenine glycosylase II